MIVFYALIPTVSANLDRLSRNKLFALYAHYTLQANHNDKHIADVEGKAYFYYLVHDDSIFYDALDLVADGYCNNQYTGKWIYLDTHDTLTCNWGDFRIPESGRLDGGCAEFIPNEAFYDNGWKTYIDSDRHGWAADPEHAYYDSVFEADINWWK